MSLIENQQRLIAQTQLLYDDLLNSGKYAEAIAISKTILDLSTALKEIGLGSPLVVRQPALPEWSAGFGEATFDNFKEEVEKWKSEGVKFIPDLQQTSASKWRLGDPLLPELEAAREELHALREKLHKQNQVEAFRSPTSRLEMSAEFKLPQPSKYSWADGFTGVTVPTRETDLPQLPNPNQISAQPTDYWEDARRQ